MPATHPFDLSAPATDQIRGLANEALAGKLTLYLGAGVSKAPPTDLPLSDELLRDVHDAAKAQFPQAFASGDPATLEELADAVGGEEPERRRLHELLLSTREFDREPSNRAHECIAFLLREGLVTVISANWDDCIERAGATTDAYLPRPTVSDGDRRKTLWSGGLHKVHGCALDPGSLVVSSKALRSPSNWVEHAVGAEIGYQVIAFVGIATVADYVGKPVKAVLCQMGPNHDRMYVVEPEETLGDTWVQILGGDSEDRHIRGSAEQFLVCLLEHLLASFLSSTTLEANNLCDPKTPVEDALSYLRTTLPEQEALPVLRWWTDGTDPSLRRGGVLRKAQARQQLLAVAVALESECPKPKEVDGVLTMELSDCYLELALANGGAGATLKRRQHDRLGKRESRGAFPKRRKPVLVLYQGSTSPTEPRQPRDVLTTDQIDDLVEGADQSRFRFRSVAEVLDRRPKRDQLLAA